MARHIFIPNPLRQGQSTTEDTNSQERHNIRSLRDLFRSGDGMGFTDLNIALNASRWKVSDIVMGKSGSNEFQYFFILRDTVDIIEYMFVFCGRDLATSPAEIGDWANFSSTYIQNINGAPPSYISSTAYTFACFINVGYTTSSFGRSWGFDNATEMTFSGGDFKDMAGVSDASSGTVWADDWWPAGGVKNPKGLHFGGNVAAGAENKMYAVVLDDVEDALAIYDTDAFGEYYVGRVGIFSKYLFNPNTAGDVNLQGSAWWEFAKSINNFAQETYSYATGFTNTGTAIADFSLIVDQNFTRQNEKVGGLYKWRSITATSPSFDKGWINSNLAIEIGAFNHYTAHRQRYAHPDTSNPCCKYSNSTAFMWAPNVPAFPFAYNGLGEGP